MAATTEDTDLITIHQENNSNNNYVNFVPTNVMAGGSGMGNKIPEFFRSKVKDTISTMDFL
jgi:hypothetical protein